MKPKITLSYRRRGYNMNDEKKENKEKFNREEFGRRL